MYYIKNMKDLKAYKISLELYQIIVSEIKIYDTNFYKVKNEVINIINNIALANGKEFYLKETIKHYKFAIYKSYILETLLQNYENKKKYISKLIEIRNILFTLIKREEKTMSSKSNKYKTEEVDYTNYTSKNLKSLKAYQLGVEYVQACIKIIDSLPNYEKYIMKDQLRRSSQSVLSNISEAHGYGDIYYKKAISSYNIALGSLKESIAQIDICYISNYISKDVYDHVNNLASQIIALVVTYIRNMCK